MVKNIHYRTCFRVKSKRQEEYSSEKLLFRKIQREFWNWIKKREKSCPDFFSDEIRNEFFYKIDKSGLGDSKSTLDSGTVISDEGNAWCFRYSHYDDKVRDRRWCLEAGLRYFKESDDIVVAVTLMYEVLESNVIFGEVKAPEPSVPGCILKIFSISETRFTFGGNNQDFGVGNILLKFGWTKLIVDFLKSDVRRFPVVVFNGNKDCADRFSKRIAGKAICVTIPEDAPDVFQAFVCGLGCDRNGDRFSIPKDGMRVFFPFTKFARSWEHPVIKLDNKSELKRLTQLILTNVIPCADWAVAVEKMSDIVRLREKAKKEREEKERNVQREEELKRLDELLKTKKEALESNKDALVSQKEEVEYYKGVAELYEQDVRHWKEKYEDAQSEIDVLNQNSQCSYGYSQAETVNLVMERLPASFEECVEIGKSHFSNLEFSEDAKKAASKASDKKSTYGKDAKNVRMCWNMLWHLDTTLFGLKFKSGRMVDLEKEVEDKSGYTYAKGEGKQSNMDLQLMREREFFHNGRKFEKKAHLKPKCRLDWRIYFDYDEVNQKIVIGHIGDHLDNATTGKRS